MDQSAEKLRDTGSYRCHPSSCQGQPSHRLVPFLSSATLGDSDIEVRDRQPHTVTYNYSKLMSSNTMTGIVLKRVMSLVMVLL